MVKPVVTYFGTINDSQEPRDPTLITDSLEVEYILNNLGYLASDDDPLDFSGLFVSIREGDYDEAYAFEGCVLCLHIVLLMIDSTLISND